MQKRLAGWLIVATGLAVILSAVRPAVGQPPTGRASGVARMPDGKPNLNGVWQTLNTANWDLEPHAAAPSPVLALGAAGAIPPGLGVVQGGPIPYLPEALNRKKENAKNWLTADPEIKCYMPGVPRATYIGQPDRKSVV